MGKMHALQFRAQLPVDLMALLLDAGELYRRLAECLADRLHQRGDRLLALAECRLGPHPMLSQVLGREAQESIAVRFQRAVGELAEGRLQVLARMRECRGSLRFHLRLCAQARLQRRALELQLMPLGVGAAGTTSCKSERDDGRDNDAGSETRSKREQDVVSRNIVVSVTRATALATRRAG
jgi:hypothetical protein